jgi:hypothetical protein
MKRNAGLVNIAKNEVTARARRSNLFSFLTKNGMVDAKEEIAIPVPSVSVKYACPN